MTRFWRDGPSLAVLLVFVAGFLLLRISVAYLQVPRTPSTVLLMLLAVLVLYRLAPSRPQAARQMSRT
jgi:hypothetical protein